MEYRKKGNKENINNMTVVSSDGQFQRPHSIKKLTGGKRLLHNIRQHTYRPSILMRTRKT